MHLQQVIEGYYMSRKNCQILLVYFENFITFYILLMCIIIYFDRLMHDCKKSDSHLHVCIMYVSFTGIPFSELCWCNQCWCYIADKILVFNIYYVLKTFYIQENMCFFMFCVCISGHYIHLKKKIYTINKLYLYLVCNFASTYIYN